MIKLKTTFLPLILLSGLMVSSSGMAVDDPYSQIIDAQQNGQYPEALSHITRLLNQNQNDVQALLLKGNVNKLMGNTDNATAIFKGLIDSHPEMPEAYNNLAVLYADAGKPALAIETLQQVFATQSSYATAYKNLRTLYNQMASLAYRDALDIQQKPKQQLSQFAMLNTVQMKKPPVPVKVSEKVPVQLASAAIQSDVTLVAQTTTTAKQPLAESVQTLPEIVIKKMIIEWAKAWAGRNIKDYFAYYHNDFVPPNNLSRARWETYRGNRLSKPKFINVDLVGVKIKQSSATTATALFEQHYRSNTYSDTVVVQLTLKKHQDKWLIVSEESL
ncbi:MAG: tetratricopeptide (TPR) repeat protein [Phenylobacterium sp.]|jgi:tetratricopeptide (TPR) repeat protein